MVYSGPPSKCMQYLSRIGFISPADYNPADFVMDLVTSTDAGGGAYNNNINIDPKSIAAAAMAAPASSPSTLAPAAADAEDSSADVEAAEETARLTKSIRTILIETWDNTPIFAEIDAATAALTAAGADGNGNGNGADDEGEGQKYLASYKTQFFTLLERALVNSRASVVTNLTVFQAVAVALICGALWWRLPYEESRITDRASYIFFFMTYWFFVTLFQGM
jgi:hypothetical protein